MIIVNMMFYKETLMKKLMLSFLLAVLVLSSSFAGSDISIGVFRTYDPIDADLFNPENLKDNSSYDFGLSSTFETRHLSFTDEIRLKGLLKENRIVQNTGFAMLKINLNGKSHIDLGLGIETSLQKAVDGSDRFYVTMGGIALDSIFPVSKPQAVKLLSIFRLRSQLSLMSSENTCIRLALTLDPRPAIQLYPEGNVMDFIALHDFTLAIERKLR